LRLKKLVELLLLKFGFNVHVKLFIIDNASVSANFMAKYLAHSFRLGFNFFDIIVPLKKNLGKLMSVRLLKS